MKRYIVLLLILAVVVTFMPGMSAFAESFSAQTISKDSKREWTDNNEGRLVDIKSVIMGNDETDLLLIIQLHRSFSKSYLDTQGIGLFLDTDLNQTTGFNALPGFERIIQLRYNSEGVLYFQVVHSEPGSSNPWDFSRMTEAGLYSSTLTNDTIYCLIPLSWLGNIKKFDWMLEVAKDENTRYDLVPNTGLNRYEYYGTPSIDPPPSAGDTNTPGTNNDIRPLPPSGGGSSGGGGGGGSGGELLELLKEDPADKEVAEEQGQKKDFGDVTINDWFYSYVRAMVDTDVVGGYADGTFRPKNPITRAEFSKMVCLAKGWELESSSTPPSFGDVGQSHWAFRYIETARNRGAISGYPDGTFGPNKNITRAELSKIICLANNYSLSQGPCDFSDCGEHWALRYIVTAKTKFIVSGYNDGSFKPNASATRAEVCKMLYQMMQ